MYVRVNLIKEDYRFFVNPSLTVKKLLSNIATHIGLQHKKCFVLQAFNEANQTWQWLKSSKKLFNLAKKCTQPELCLHLRARSIPLDFGTFKQDPVAMKLFYWNICQSWSEGYDPESAIETCLLALHLLVELGPLSQMAQTNQWARLSEMIKRYFKKIEDPDSAINNVLRLWQLFGNMSTDEAIYSFCSIATLEQCFVVKHSEEILDLKVVYDGIKIQDGTPDGSLSIDWAQLRKVSQRDNRIILKPASSNWDKHDYKCESKKMAQKAWETIVAYHQVHLQKKFSRGGPSTCLLLGAKPEQFLQNIISSFSVPPAKENYQLDDQQDDHNEEISYQNDHVDSVDSELAKIIHKLDRWIGKNETKEDNITQTIKEMLAMCAEIHQKVVQESQNKESKNEKDLQEIEDLAESVSQDGQQEEEPPSEAKESDIEQLSNESNADIIMTYQDWEQSIYDSSTDNEMPVVMVEGCMANEQQSEPEPTQSEEEILPVAEEEPNESEKDKEMQLSDNENGKEEDENEMGELQNSEVTRRKRFAKLRLSLFEHDRF